LKTRNKETQEMSAHVIGGMCTFIKDTAILAPYVDELIAGMKNVLFESHPDLRGAAARAMRSLNEGLAGAKTEEIRTWLDIVLNDENSIGVQQMGAAEGLSELYASLPNLDEVMQDELKMIHDIMLNNPSSTVRQSWISVMRYLPGALSKSLIPYLEDMIKIVTAGFNDTSDDVREVAQQAGVMTIFVLGGDEPVKLALLLKENLGHVKAHVRENSLKLLGNLLFSNAGGEGDISNDSECTPEMEMKLEKILGVSVRNEIYAAVYMRQSDNVRDVSQAARLVWRALVSNPKRMLKTVTQSLRDNIMAGLTGDEEEQEGVSESLSSLVKTNGQQIITQFLPVFSQYLQSAEVVKRKGACIGVKSILTAATKNQLLPVIHDITPCLSLGLRDTEDEVRESAGDAFRLLNKNSGGKATNELVPPTVKELLAKEYEESEETEALFAALQMMLRMDPTDGVMSTLVPFLVPEEEERSMSLWQLTVLSKLAREMSAKMENYLEEIFLKIVSTCSGETDPEDQEELRAISGECFVHAIGDESVHSFVDMAVDVFRDDSDKVAQITVLKILASFLNGVVEGECLVDPELLEDKFDALISQALACYTSKSQEVIEAAVVALTSTVNAIPKEIRATKVVKMYEVLEDISTSPLTGDRVQSIPGFDVNGGLKPLWDIYHPAMTKGDPEDRAVAAKLFSEIVLLTKKLNQRDVIRQTGPIIRISTWRVAPNVLIAALKTIKVLIVHIPVQIKSFVTQLKTVFLKMIKENAHRQVREEAISGFREFLRWQMSILRNPPVGRIVEDLCDKINSSSDADLQRCVSVLQALCAVLTICGEKVKPESLATVRDTVEPLMEREESLADGACRCFGQTCRLLDEDEFEGVLDEQVDTDDDMAGWKGLRTKCWVLCEIIQSCPERLTEEMWGDVDDFIEELAERPEQPLENLVVEVAFRRMEGLCACNLNKRIPSAVKFLEKKKNLVQGDAAIELCENIKQFSRKSPEIVDSYLVELVTICVSLARRHEQDLKHAAQIAIQTLLRLKEGEDRLQKVLQQLDPANASVTGKLCRTIRY